MPGRARAGHWERRGRALSALPRTSSQKQGAEGHWEGRGRALNGFSLKNRRPNSPKDESFDVD